MTTILNIKRTGMFNSIIMGALILSAVGCGGMKPNPIYHSGKSETPTPKRVNDPGRTNKSTLLSAGRIRSTNKVLMLKSINSYKGVPYLWAGDTRRGMDCSGFTMKVFQESSNYTLPHNAAAQYKLGFKVNQRQLKLGDLVFFRDIESKGISHVGIYVGDDMFAHASLSKGVVYSSMKEDYYRKRYVSARRILR